MATSTVFTTAQHLLASHAASTSQATFVYPSASEAGFGAGLKEREDGARGKVYEMETRTGAGAAPAGYLNALIAPSTSSQPLSEGPVSALVGSATLGLMAPSLLSLNPGPRPSFAIHTALVSQGDLLSEGLGGALTFASQLSTFDVDDRTAMVFSGSRPRDIVGVGIGLASALSKAGYDLVHAFDGVEGGIEQTVFSPIGTTVADKVGSSTSKAASLEEAVASALWSVSQSVGSHAADFFSYSGSPSATHIFVVPASAAASHATAALDLLPPSTAAQVGVLSVRVLRPWSTVHLARALPESAQTLHVYTEAGSEFLLELVLGSVAEFKRPIRAIAAHVPADSRLTAPIWAAQMGAVVVPSPEAMADDALPPTSLLPEGSKLVSVWSSDDPKDGAVLAARLAKAFTSENGGGVEPRLAVEYDNYSQGGLQHASLLLSPPETTSPFTPAVIASSSPASLVVLQNPSTVLAAYSPLAPSNLAPTTQVLVAAPGWTPEEYEVKFDAQTKEGLWQVFGTQESDPTASQGGVWSVDINTVSAATRVLPTVVTEVAVWLLYVGEAGTTSELVRILEDLDAFKDLQQVSGLVIETRKALKHVRIPPSWERVVQNGESLATESARAADVALTHGLPTQESITESQAGSDLSFGKGDRADRGMAADDSRKMASVVQSEAQPEIKPSKLVSNALAPNPHKVFAEPDPKQGTWRDAAKALLFREAYGTVADSKRPDLPEQNFILTVTENRRLTPLDYDRNVFHMELSTAGTGLKYEIGEALGVHGWNDEAEVREFIESYGLDADALISLPNRDEAYGVEEKRTVFQAFQQNLDIFGKPPKSFFEELSKVATVKAEKDSLHFIASAEGSSTFKKWSETDTVTYADVFKAFPSARFSVADLVRNVELIKPRHYSIASSQNFVGDSVHLLVVTVDWQTPGGAMRYGQCTRYLASLNVGDKVVVSVKPSVMKLPPKDTAPVIMAGLGTGAAPFRAFIQERAWQRSKGIDVGPLYYYFGSRHRSKEYLYGEELEAYMKDRILTHAGLAFSRDGPKKVYIQHKMMEDSAKLAESLSDGAFYLCGPTWPVSDVHEALCQALGTTGKTHEEAEAFLQEMKEKEAYVLETY